MNNRIHNARNPYQGNFRKVLCVCSAGLLRSPTIAWILSNPPYNFNTRAVGVDESFALIPLDEVLLSWADDVVFVHKSAELSARAKFDIDKFITLALPDNYEYRAEGLIEVAKKQLAEAFSLPEL